MELASGGFKTPAGFSLLLNIGAVKAPVPVPSNS